jgi:dihydroorotase
MKLFYENDLLRTSTAETLLNSVDDAKLGKIENYQRFCSPVVKNYKRTIETSRALLKQLDYNVEIIRAEFV